MKTRKKKIMYMIFVMIMVRLQLEIVAASDGKNYINAPFFFTSKQRKETRSKNDFRPDSLSTAPGFGKRKDPFVPRINIKYGRPQSVRFVSATHPTNRIMTYWFLQYMRRYPDISSSLFKIESLNTEKRNNHRLMSIELLKMRNFTSFL